MKSVCFALVMVVALGVMGVSAKADTMGASASRPTVDGLVQPSSQAGTGANTDALDAGAASSTVVAAVPPDSQASATESDKREKRKIRVSANLYAFIPSNGETRDNFGSIWGSVGIGLFRPERPERWVFDWDATVWAKHDTSKVLLIPVTVGVQRGLSRDPDRQSYLAVRVGPYYGKVDNNQEGPDDSTIGVNANLALGMVVNQKYVFEARYDWFTKLAGNNLSGLTLTAGVKVLQFSF